jgi:hypothetical protein
METNGETDLEDAMIFSLNKAVERKTRSTASIGGARRTPRPACEGP